MTIMINIQYIRRQYESLNLDDQISSKDSAYV